MHLLVRETRSLDEEAAAVDLGQTPADIVFLSFSDADLGAAAMAWRTMEGAPTLRLANLARLRHPMSVDLYVEQVVSHARCVVVRLLGGFDYWPYGVQEFAAICRANGTALVVVPGDARDDSRLLEYSTANSEAVAMIDAYLREGGPVNVRNALRLAAHLGGIGEAPAEPPDIVASAGLFSPSPCGQGNRICQNHNVPVMAGLDPAIHAVPPEGVGTSENRLRMRRQPHPVDGRVKPGHDDVRTDWANAIALPCARGSEGGVAADWTLRRHPSPNPLPQGEGAFCSAAIVFYRSHLLAGDVAPIEALAAALEARGLNARAIYVTSLKDPSAAGFVADHLREWRPSVVLNATAFSAGQDSPLGAAGVPVLQVVLAGSDETAWAASSRGVSQSDMAMQVVLPELDGRLLTTAISFKSATETLQSLDFAPVLNRPDADGIALAADRAFGWARLAATPAGARRLAIVLSDYPSGGQIGHAVGLDSFASLSAILADLADAGYDAVPAGSLTDALCHAEPTPFLGLAEYRQLFATLPAVTQAKIMAAWGDPADDPAVRGGQFGLRHVARGTVVVAVQPDRGNALDRKASYHDPDLPPRHAYVAFYLWLRLRREIHALVHLGTHGTLEWLPGKAAALSAACTPAALVRGLPVIYPFIVNNPGEAAAAKRRLGAVTIGHLTPPLRAAGTHGAATDLERLIDEYAAADGLDRRRAQTLRAEILARAESAGLLAESGVARGAPEDEALARLDAYLCDVKELQIRDGLHVFGRAPTPEQAAMLRAALLRFSPPSDLDACAPAERAALLAALDGKFVRPGPAGAPTRGRADVLPTGRNLFAIDPRAVPTRSAVALAERAAADLLQRHRQDHGDWPRSLVVDLWGSATLRTGGEDFALALVLLGAKPVWDEGSARVNGIEILPIAVLDRPRVDVTLRISGLFRDAFEGLIALFDSAVRAIAGRDEAVEWNPLAHAPDASRIFGAAPGAYGAGLSDVLARNAWTDRDTLGDAYLAASAHAYGKEAGDFAARVATADAFVHQQDHAETDLLEGTEYAAHEGGFAAAAQQLGANPALYHMDTSRPDAPRTRTLAEEVARIVRGRAANPVWIAGMMRHGYRGGTEIARALDGLHGFAATLPTRFDAQFDLLFDATLGEPAVDEFLQAHNPDARAAMAEKFRDALRRGIWRPRRNTPAERLAA